MNRPQRVLAVLATTVALGLAVPASAVAQEPDPPPTEVNCSPFSIFCGLQIGPFYFDILPGGSVFPPPPPPPA